MSNDLLASPRSARLAASGHRRRRSFGHERLASSRRALICATILSTAFSVHAQPFQLPTANHALFEPRGEERFFVGTVGKPWTTGTFGCVRTDGWQLHEGLDIKCLQRDKAGEPADLVLASADGVVAYCSTRPSLSNYGNYLLLRHQVDGLEVYSLYAHLREVLSGIAVGRNVK